MNATTLQAEGWQGDVRDRNTAVAQMAHRIQELERDLALSRQRERELESLLGIGG